MSSVPPRPVDHAALRAALAGEIVPYLTGHAGGAIVHDVSPSGVVTIEFHGACRSCPLQPVTLRTRVAHGLRNVEGVTEVRTTTGRLISEHARARLAALTGAEDQSRGGRSSSLGGAGIARSAQPRPA